jgi:hypothetical protein
MVGDGRYVVRLPRSRHCCIRDDFFYPEGADVSVIVVR